MWIILLSYRSELHVRVKHFFLVLLERFVRGYLSYINLSLSNNVVAQAWLAVPDTSLM